MFFDTVTSLSSELDFTTTDSDHGTEETAPVQLPVVSLNPHPISTSSKRVTLLSLTAVFTAAVLVALLRVYKAAVTPPVAAPPLATGAPPPPQPVSSPEPTTPPFKTSPPPSEPVTQPSEKVTPPLQPVTPNELVTSPSEAATLRPAANTPPSKATAPARRLDEETQVRVVPPQVWAHHMMTIGLETDTNLQILVSPAPQSMILHHEGRDGPPAEVSM
ncbi:hypothetical protein Esti_004194 [Eimeria stiedai]